MNAWKKWDRFLGWFSWVVLGAEVDTATSETVAVAAPAYRKGVFIAGKVLVKNGSDYEAVSAAQAIVLRGQNIELAPMDDWSKAETTADNTIS